MIQKFRAFLMVTKNDRMKKIKPQEIESALNNLYKGCESRQALRNRTESETVSFSAHRIQYVHGLSYEYGFKPPCSVFTSLWDSMT